MTGVDAARPALALGLMLPGLVLYSTMPVSFALLDGASSPFFFRGVWGLGAPLVGLVFLWNWWALLLRQRRYWAFLLGRFAG